MPDDPWWSQPLDTSPLTDPIDRDTLLAYRADLPSPLGRARGWSIAGASASAASAVVLFAYWIAVIGPDGFARADWSQWLLYGAGGAVVGVIPVLIVRHVVRGWRGAGGRRQYRLDRFARANGMDYRPVPSALRDRPAGMVFERASEVRVRDLLTRAGRDGLEVGSASVVTGDGRGRRVDELGFATVGIGARLPHLVLDATSNDGPFGRSSLALDIDPSQRLRLEGDFDGVFAVYCPVGYERDALLLLTPEVMTALVDHAAGFDLEIVDDRLVLVATTPIDSLDPAAWLDLQVAIGALLDRAERWGRWRDPRLGETRVVGGAIRRGPVGVAPPGRRLAARLRWGWIVAAVIVLGAGAVGMVAELFA